MYAPNYRYKVGEKDFQYRSSTHFGSMPVVGQTVTLEYSEQQPQYAYRTDGLDWLMNKGPRYLGLTLIIASRFCIRFQYCIDFGRNIFDHSFAPRSPRCKFREPRAQYQQDLERNNPTLENESVKLYMPINQTLSGS